MNAGEGTPDGPTRPLMRYVLNHNPIVALATAGNPFSGAPAAAWIYCADPDCTNRGELHGLDVDDLTDAEVGAEFARHGWAFEPSRCPTHAGGLR